MTLDGKVKVRKIIYNKNGYQQGELLPEYPGDIDQAFDHYSKKWFFDHTDKNGDMFDYISEKDCEYVDEFIVKESDYFYVGIPNTYAYEGITDDYTGYAGCELDDYGFEKMYNSLGEEVKYFDPKTK